MAAILAGAGIPATVKADSVKVVTLGANLSSEQRQAMYEYFGTSADKVETLEVNNADERKYMEGIATEAQIGTRTYSCSYVEPTTSGGIQVKVANLTFVTSSMIASTLLTSGVENCNVVASSPIEVSGTGALTGIMMAYEKASGEVLDEGQKETAAEELITTGAIAESVGQQEAADIMNDVKAQVIEEDLSQEDEIKNVIDKVTNEKNVTLTEEQIQKVTDLMKRISQYDYDVKALEKTLNNIAGKSEGFFAGIWSSIKGAFSSDSKAGGIINNTKDELLGAGAVIDSTIDGLKEEQAEDGQSIWDKISGFFEELFGGNDSATEKETDTAAEENQS